MAADLDSVRRAYTAALLARDTTRARALVDTALKETGDPAGIDFEVLTPAMHDIGALWEQGEITVAEEHYATGVTEGVMAVLAASMRRPPAGGRLAVVTCPPGERHALAARMLADVLEANAWEALQLGPDVPIRALLELVVAEQPDVVATSVTMPDSVDATVEMLAALATLEPRPFLAVGGQALRGVTADLGADLVALHPGELLDLVRERFPPLPPD
jgi:MerR family transcriptional regulator, light-induced transcriptional regulator